MKIRALKISIITTQDEYGFSCVFKDGLNIVRGNNSSGKSTLFNTMIYSLGMEELLGGRGSKVLPYALKEYIPLGDEKIAIVNSSVSTEIENKDGRVITLNRAIRSSDKSNKLIEVIEGNYLTGTVENVSSQPTYLHDAGSAKNSEVGFFKVLEEFIGFDLPLIPSTSGDEVKLYIQTLFAGFFVEQKRGWTDYIANVPYFRIKDAKSRVVEFLLDLDVFENDRKLNTLNVQSIELNKNWDVIKAKVKLIEDNRNIFVEGIPVKPLIDFDVNLIAIKKIQGDKEISLHEYIGAIDQKLSQIKSKQENKYGNAPKELVQRMETVSGEVVRLNSLFETGVR